MFHLKEHKTIHKKFISEDYIGVQGGGGGDTCGTIIDIPNITIFYGHLGFWIGNNYFGLKCS